MNNANNLRKLRFGSQLSLKELSEYCGIALTVLSYLENGKRDFRQEHIDRLCAFFDVSSDYLMGRSRDGIGIYFIRNDAAGSEYARIGEDELSALEAEGKLSSSVRVANPSIGAYTDDGRSVDGLTRYVFRSAEASAQQASRADKLREKAIAEIRSMTEKELDKTLRFINEYIK